jgi:hypothetical protein
MWWEMNDGLGDGGGDSGFLKRPWRLRLRVLRGRMVSL